MIIAQLLLAYRINASHIHKTLNREIWFKTIRNSYITFKDYRHSCSHFAPKTLFIGHPNIIVFRKIIHIKIGKEKYILYILVSKPNVLNGFLFQIVTEHILR